MTDITMCINITCPMRETCHRATAKPSHWRYAEFKPDADGECKYYWDNGTTEKTTEEGTQTQTAINLAHVDTAERLARHIADMTNAYNDLLFRVEKLERTVIFLTISLAALYIITQVLQ